MPSKKKKYNARFPPARIKKIMQTDEEVGKVAATVPVIISRALELFIESLILQASQTTLSKKARTLSASHLKQTIQSEKKYDFLRELVANIPDHQTEEEGGDNISPIEHQDKSNQGAVKRPCGRPRKPRDPAAAAQKKERKRKQPKVESSEDSDSDDSEETDDAVEDSEGEDGASCSSNSIGSAPSTSSGVLLMPQTPTSVPTVAPYSGMAMYPAGGVPFQGFSDGAAPPVPPYLWSLQGPGPLGFPQMPLPMIRTGLRTAEDDDYDT